MSQKAVEKLMKGYEHKRSLIKSRLRQFKQVFKKGDDVQIFLELTFCIFTANATARMGLKSINAVSDILMNADAGEISQRLKGVHRFPNSRARYLFLTREYLKSEFDFKLKDLIISFEHPLKRRDFFASCNGIKGIGYKEASHFLRNIGFGGYAILDKHILRSLYDFNVIDNLKPPITRNDYLRIENKLRKFAKKIDIDMDELDLLLWSERTGEILK